MLKGQTIDSGNNSTNVQGKEVTFVQNNMGLSYSDVKDIAMNVFKSNFYDLGEKVEELVQERAEKLLDDYLDKLKEKNPKYIKNTEDPDLRYVIYEAQKNYARRNDINIEKLLVDTLVERTIYKGDSIKELVLNEALSIIPKLTSKQIDILSLIFFVKYVRGNLPTAFIVNIMDRIRGNINIDERDNFYQHLQYTSCISISIGQVDFYSTMIGKSAEMTDVSKTKEIVDNNSKLSSIRSMWDNSQLCHASLTSVGLAIAIVNINTKLGLGLDYDIWIK